MYLKKHPSLEINQEVLDVLAYIERTVVASRFVSVSEAVAKIAPILWDRYQKEEISPLLLRYPAPISDHELHTQSSSSELPPVK